MTGAEYLCKTLHDCGITFFTGIPGTDTTDVYNICEQFGIHPVVVRNELFAPMIADGYARVSRKLGLVLSVPGPGALALTSGLMEAYASSIPMIVIATDIPRAFRNQGKGYLHEVRDLEKVFSSVSTRSVVINHAHDFSFLFSVKEDLQSARPRPYLLVVPSDVYQENVIVQPYRSFHTLRLPDPRDIAYVVSQLTTAKRPIIVAGAGVWWDDAMRELAHLAETLSIPVFTSINGKGVVSDGYCIGFGQLIGEPEMQTLITQSDLMLAVGTRWSDRSTGRWSLTLPQNSIAINIADEATAHYSASYTVVGRIKRVLRSVNYALKETTRSVNGEWLLSFQQAKQKVIQRLCAEHPLEMNVIAEIRRALPPDTIVVNDSAIATYWTRRYFSVYRPGTFLWPMGSGTIGWAIPAAIGAALAVRERNSNERVVAMVGDGGLQYSMQELGTMIQEKLPIIILLFDNSAYGVIQHFQENRYGKKTPATELKNPSFRLLAQSYGIRYRAVLYNEPLDQVLAEVLRHEEPVLIHYQEALNPPPRL